MAVRNRSIPELMHWLECPYRHRLLYARGLWPLKELRQAWLYNGLARGTAERVTTGSYDGFFRDFSTRYLHAVTCSDSAVGSDADRLRKDLVHLHATLEAWAGSWEDPTGEWKAELAPVKRGTRGAELVWYWPLIFRGSNRPPLCWLPWDPGPLPGPISALIDYDVVEYGWPSTTELRSKINEDGPSTNPDDYSDQESFDAALASADDEDSDPEDYAGVREMLLPRSEALLLYRTVERGADNTAVASQPLKMFSAIRNGAHGTWRNPSGGRCATCGFHDHCAGTRTLQECAGKHDPGRMRGLGWGVSVT